MPSIPLSVPLERQSPSKMELEDLDNGTGAVPQTCGSARKYECSPDEGGSLASSSSVVRGQRAPPGPKLPSLGHDEDLKRRAVANLAQMNTNDRQPTGTLMRQKTMKIASKGKFKNTKTKNVFKGLYAAQFKATHGQEYVDQISLTRERIRAIDRQKRLVLHPNKHRWLGFWDMVSTLALLYTATLTPVETAFTQSVYGPRAWTDPWFLINRLLDVIFSFDMGLQFFVAYQQVDGKGNVKWVEIHNDIIRHYLRTWFPLDAFTIVAPLGFDLYSAFGIPESANSPSLGGDAGAAGDMSALRVLRVLRLIKLVRLVRASRLYERWKTRITLSTGMQTMLTCTLMVLIAAHWYACIMALQASLQDTPHTSYLGPALYGFCRTSPSNLTVQEMSDMSPSDLEKALVERSQGGLDGPIPGCDTDLTAGSWYLASLAWSMMILTGTGGTDFYPSSQSDFETGIVMVLIVFGALLWTRVLAMFCDVATNSNPGLTYFNQQLDGLNEFIKTNEVPKEMARRMREYLHQMKGAQLQEHAARSLPSLSPALQIELVLFCHRHWVDAIWFLKGLDEVVLVRLAMSMKSRVLAPGEVAPTRSMYVVSRGCVLFGGRVLSKGMAWGDDVILHNERYFLPYLARAMSYVDVQVLSRETLLSVTANFPAARKLLRRAGTYLALRRYLVEEVKRIKEREHMKGDLLDQMYAHSQTAHKKFSSEHQSNAVAMSLALHNAVEEQGQGGSSSPSRGAMAKKDAEEMQRAIASLQAQQDELLSTSKATQEQMKGLQASVDALTRALSAK